MFDTLRKNRFVMVNKSRFSGMSEANLRYMLYLVLCEHREGDLLGICSTNLDLSKSMARRQKAIMASLGVYDMEESRETILEFPKSRIQWMPSDPSSLRGYNPSYVALEEYFHTDFTTDLFAVVDSFSIRSPTVQILGISTPGGMQGGGYEMWNAKDSIYNRITISYKDCINLMYTEQQLEKLRLTSPSFSQEYENKFSYSKTGSTFTTQSIDQCITSKPITHNPNSVCFTGWDTGFSAPSAAVVGQLSDGYFEILHAKEYEQKQADFEGMVDEAVRLFNEYDVEYMYLDGSSPSFVSAVRERCGLDPDYNSIITRNKANKIPWDTGLYIIPIAFGKYNRDMLFNAKILLEKNGVRIPQDKTELIDFLRNCKDSDGRILKKLSPHNHVGDALLLALRGIELEGDQ